MPLLHGKPLDLCNYTKRLADDEEVFYHQLTNEIFEDYEDYSDRHVTCGSMVWSCAITGKSGLTYKEALQSEEQALKNIKDFPPELRTPVLYLAMLTKRELFQEMADDVFNFIQERYFVAESVQACFDDDDDWTYGQVLRVLMPTAEEVLDYCEKNKVKHPIHHRPFPAALYKYEIEEVFDDGEEDDDVQMVGRKAILPYDKVRRMKHLYTKKKSQAYLKQFTEQKSGIWVVKEPIIKKYSISTLKFQNIFEGEPPEFLPLKKRPSVSKMTPKSGKLTQSSMKSFLINKGTPKSVEKSNNSPNAVKSAPKSLSHSAALKIQKKYAATIDKVASNAQGKKEEERLKKLELLQKKREDARKEKEKLAMFAKEWQKKREDLECDDLKELPAACTVDCSIPNNLFGEFIMILEFFFCFREVLKCKDFFPFGLTFELLERALTETEVAGPFSDILQLLLSALFEFQEQEDDEVKNKEFSGDISLNESGDMSAREAIKSATLAARWSKTYHNVPLNELNMDAITVTDILRLHLLSSGGRAGDLSGKWRYQERGGYTSTDDPGLEFRLNEPHILKFLACNSVATLPITDKLKVVNCLMNQILTYASVRDVMDERYEKVSLAKKELKNDQIADSKSQREKLKQQKEAKEEGKAVDEEVEKLKNEKEVAKKKSEYQKRWDDLQEVALGFQVLPLGRDRGFRRYWIFSALPGLFIEDDEEWPGECLANPTVCNKPSVTADEEDTMSYIRKLFEAGRSGTGSDKENEGNVNQTVGSPKKKHFGEMNGMCITSPTPSTMSSPVKTDDSRALTCTANKATCSIHNRSLGRSKWLFFYRDEDVNDLIKTLNKRGYREHALRQTIITEKDRITRHLAKCPVLKLNRFVPLILDSTGSKMVSTRSMKGYEDAYLGYPKDMHVNNVIEMYVREVILDTEEKIYAGGLGCIKVNNRDNWRAALRNCSYESQDAELTWPTKMVTKAAKDEEEQSSRPDTPCSVHSSSDHEETGRPEQDPKVRDLAMAVLQIARSITPKYLKKPLPYEEKKPIKLTAMERWELSLMHSTSVTQVYLHLGSLENSIQWQKSVLKVRCKLCRRGKDDANMLLCDGCDRGFHLYCLKPELKQIPKGEWFCVSCRPKEKTPRKAPRRRYFEEEEDSEDDRPISKRPKRGRN